MSYLVIDKSCINIHKFCCDKITSVIYPKKLIFEKENSYVQKYNIAICLVSEKFRKYLTAEEQKNKMIYWYNGIESSDYVMSVVSLYEHGSITK